MRVRMRRFYNRPQTLLKPLLSVSAMLYKLAHPSFFTKQHQQQTASLEREREMERSANNRKRAREDDDHPVVSVAKIKPDLINARGYYVHREFETTDKQHSFDGIFDTTEIGYNNNNAACADVEEGLFDFPWLKEGMAFKAEDYEESDFDNIFVSSYPSSSTLQDDASDSKAEEQNLCQFPKLLNFDDDDKQKKKKKNNYEDDLLPPTFQADQLEGPDWICSCVFD